MVPPLAFFCVHALAPVPDQLADFHPRRVGPSQALLDALAAPGPSLWAVLAQLVHPLPAHLHDRDVPLAHPALPLLQKIPDSPDFSLVTLVTLSSCPHLRDDDVASLRSLHRLHALDLRGCPITSYALTALARGLDGPGTRRLRLLSLHGCLNVDDGVLSPLTEFPLLSAIDLRFTRCTPTAVNARLSPLGFGPSANKSLFHPAPLSLALCSLEKVALAAQRPISLYSCPPQSVFRVHIDGLDRPPKKAVPCSTMSTEDAVVFFPPLRKQTTSLPPEPSVLPIEPDPDSNVSSFYENAATRSRKNILPLSAQAVQSSEGGKLDPFAIARSPPPWNVLDTFKYGKSSRRMQPAAHWVGQTLQVDRTRLHKRGSDPVADMVHQFTRKRPKIESEFALAKAQARVSIKSRNPFVKNVRSVFAENDTPRVHESSKGEAPLRVCQSLPSETTPQQRTNVGATSSKPLKPITSLKPPILPKELLPSIPRRPSKPRTELKQTRLSFASEVE